MPNPFARSLAAWFVPLVAILGLAEHTPAADFKPLIDKLVVPLVVGKPGRGIVVGIVTKNGREVIGYGDMAVLKGTGLVGDVIFEIGSFTKVFTTLVLGDMVRDGAVKLEDPVQLHLPKEAKAPKKDDKEITLLHLATHTSGIPRLPPSFLFYLLFHPKDSDNPYAHYSAKELFESLASYRLPRKPGAKEEYSNLGMGLLGIALVQRSGAQSYEDLVVRRVCGPLGMKDTRITLSAEQQKRFADGYDEDGEPTSHWDFMTIEGCGALRSSANDLLTFLEANMGMKETKLRPAMELCQQAHAVPGSKNLQLALGWQIAEPKAPAKPIFWHNGGTGGFRCFAGFVKEAKTAVVVLSNAAQFDDKIDDLGISVLKILNGQEK